MVVKYAWSRQGTLLRWCSRLNFWLSSETVASTWTGSHIFVPDRMGNCWTRRQTPSMLRNRSQNRSKDGYRPGPRIQIPNTRSLSSGINWLNFVNEQGKTSMKTRHLRDQVNPAQAPLQLPFNGRSWTAPTLLLHQPLNQHAYSPFPQQPTNGWLITCQALWLSEPLENSPRNSQSLRRNVPCWPPHYKDRNMVGSTTSWSSWNCSACSSYDGHSCQPHEQELWCHQSPPRDDSGHQHDQLTSSSAWKEAQAQGASIPLASSSFDDSGHLHFDSLHHGFYALSFSRLSHHPNSYDGAVGHPWSSAQSEAKSYLGRVCQSHPFVGIHTHSPQPFCADIFPVPVHLSSFHTYYEYATQILYWVCHAPYSGSRIQSLQKVLPTHQRQTGPSWTGSSLLERTRQPVYLGSNPNIHGTSRLSMSWTGFDLYASSSIHEKASLRNLWWTPMLSLDLPPSGDDPDTSSLHRSSKTSWHRNSFNTGWNFGLKFTP